MTPVEELTLKLLDDDITDRELLQLQEILEQDSQARQLHFALMEQEAVLRGERRNLDLAKATMHRLDSLKSSWITRGVMKKIKSKHIGDRTMSTGKKPPGSSSGKQRLFVKPEELGLTSRIKRAIVQQNMGITQRIKRAVETTRDEKSFFFMQRNHFFMVGTLLFLLVLFAVLAFRSRTHTVLLRYPNKETVPTTVSFAFYESSGKIEIPSYTRTIKYNRIDFYGTDIKEEDFEVYDHEGRRMQNKFQLKPGSYTILVKKPGYQEKQIPLRVGESNVEIPVSLEPKEIPRRPLVVYIQDNLAQGRLIQPDNIVLKNGKSIKDIQVRPGSYVVEISKKGYHSKEAIIHVPENGIVEEKVHLDYKKRPAKFLVNDGLSKKGEEPELDERDLTLVQDAKRVAFQQGLLMPGYYQLIVERDGYAKFEDRIKIEPGETTFVYRAPLKPLEREIVVKTNYDITPAEVRPDKAFLKDIYSSTKQIIPITDGLKVAPGYYWLNVEKARYYAYTREIFISPGSAPFEIKAHMILDSKTIIMKILSDFDVEPNTIPDKMKVDMMLAKDGYEKVDWKKLLQSLPPEKKQVEVTVHLVTIPRRVIPEIKAKGSPALLEPNLITLTRVRNGQQEKTEEVTTGKEFKPGRYLLNVHLTGYAPIEKEEVLISPSSQDFILRKELEVYPVEFIPRVDSNYDPGVELALDEILLDGKTIKSGDKKKPGKYRLAIKKAGYESIEEPIEIVPSDKPFEYKNTLKAKPRIIKFDIKGDENKPVTPDQVTADGTETSDGAEILPKKVYTFNILKEGYIDETFSASIEPAEEPYILNAQLVAKTRIVNLSVVASFPKDQNLLSSLDKCTLGSFNMKEGSQEIKPGKHELLLVRSGYETIKEMIDIDPSEEALNLRKVMKPKPRRVTIDLQFDVQPENPEVARVIKMQGEDELSDIIVETGKEVVPNNYTLRINVDGYEPVSEQITIAPSEDHYNLSRKMISLDRRVRFSVTGDYPPNEKLQNVTISIDGKPMEMVGMVKPGQHSLRIESDGYQALQKDITILAGIREKFITEVLNAKERVVTFNITDAESGEALKPDSVKLSKVTVDGIREFKPGRFELEIRLKGYNPIVEDQFELPVGVGPHNIDRAVTASLRLVKYEITGDYDIGKPLQPQTITLNGEHVDGNRAFNPGDFALVIFVPGYERYTRTETIETGRDTHTIQQRLVAKSRKVVFNITANFPKGVKLSPDKVLFNSKELNDGEQVKPISSGYQVGIEKAGYDSISRNMVIEPSEDNYRLSVELQAKPRALELQVDSDYKPGSYLELDEVRIGDREVSRGDRVVPGDHVVTLKKSGYETMVFKERIEPGTQPFILKKTLVAKPRPVVVKAKSDFTDDYIEPNTLTLSDAPVRGAFKPGSYELTIGHPGYAEIRERVEVSPGESAQLFEKTLSSLPRRILTDITFDVRPPGRLAPHIIKVSSKRTPAPIQISANEELKPGKYKVVIEKEGYELLEKEITIAPDVKPFPIKEELIAKYVQILINIAHDIDPVTNNYPIAKVTFVDSNGLGRLIEHRKYIKPGDYSLEITQPGYDFPFSNKKIYVNPSTEPYHVDEKLIAKPRTLSFGILHDGVIRQAQQIVIDEKVVTPKDTFKPGKSYNFVAKFLKYQTVNKPIVIPAGEGPYVVDVDLVELQQFELRIGKRFHNLSLNNIRYPVEIYADGKQLESHHVVPGEGFGLIYYTYYAPKKSRGIRVVAGVHYDEGLISDSVSMPDLGKIDPVRLVEHISELSKSTSPFEAVKAVRTLLKDKKDNAKLKALPLGDLERVINALRDLRLADGQQRKVLKDTIKQLQEK